MQCGLRRWYKEGEVGRVGVSIFRESHRISGIIKMGVYSRFNRKETDIWKMEKERSPTPNFSCQDLNFCHPLTLASCPYGL